MSYNIFIISSFLLVVKMLEKTPRLTGFVVFELFNFDEIYLYVIDRPNNVLLCKIVGKFYRFWYNDKVMVSCNSRHIISIVKFMKVRTKYGYCKRIKYGDGVNHQSYNQHYQFAR